MICFNCRERNHEIFHKWISKRQIQSPALTPIIREDAEAAQITNINSGQLLDNWPRPKFLWPALSSRQLGWHCHLNSIALCNLLETGDELVIGRNGLLNHLLRNCVFVQADLLQQSPSYVLH